MNEETDGHATDKAADAALRNDLTMIRNDWQCGIVYIRKAYHLRDLGFLALLTLSNSDHDALALLDQAYPNAEQPPHVRGLLNRMRQFASGGVVVTPAPRLVQATVSYQLDSATYNKARRAVTRRQWLRFRYRSSRRPGEEEHCVVPVELLVRDGHCYMVSYVPDPPCTMLEREGDYVEFRVDRIVPGTARSGEAPPPDAIPPRPVFRVVYTLRPEVARNRRVSHLLSNTEIDYAPNGSATVSAETNNLWQARQLLLKYGAACRVVSPPALVALFRETARGFAELYAT